ncbi:MAG: hypothetical protein ACAI35_05085, partial [Candidatus Methylacidiphilales bacterium]
MTNWLLQLFTSGDKLPPGSEWRVGFDGMSPGWALVIWIILSAATVASYIYYARDVPRRWQRVMMILRILVIGLVLLLLTKPVVHLTINEPVRQNLLVLVDTSTSMQLSDRRTSPDDLKRAAIAAGKLDPKLGLKQNLSGELPKELATATRWDLLNALARNDRLKLWTRLQEKSNLSFYRFGRDAVTLGVMEPGGGRQQLDNTDAVDFFRNIQPNDAATGIGEGLRQVLEQNRGQAVAGIL